jgi:hypothetical protein
MPDVNQFATVKEAKDYLAGRIVAEANREGIPLSEIERKMLYFSETNWTLPDTAEVSAEFDRKYDQDEYEEKVARLIANVTADRHHRNRDEEEKWDAAVHKLSEEDHYLLVLISEAKRTQGGLSSILNNQPIRTPRDFLKALLVAFVLISSIFALFALVEWFSETKLWQATGWELSGRVKGFVVMLILVGGFALAVRLWPIRPRSRRRER